MASARHIYSLDEGKRTFDEECGYAVTIENQTDKLLFDIRSTQLTLDNFVSINMDWYNKIWYYGVGGSQFSIPLNDFDLTKLLISYPPKEEKEKYICLNDVVFENRHSPNPIPIGEGSGLFGKESVTGKFNYELSIDAENIGFVSFDSYLVTPSGNFSLLQYDSHTIFAEENNLLLTANDKNQYYLIEIVEEI